MKRVLFLFALCSSIVVTAQSRKLSKEEKKFVQSVVEMQPKWAGRVDHQQPSIFAWKLGADLIINLDCQGYAVLYVVNQHFDLKIRFDITPEGVTQWPEQGTQWPEQN
jgi:hypothetical protein